MKDITALAYVNMYGVLGALEDLCRMDDLAQAILAQLKRPVSLCLEVRNGPCRTFHFSREGCRVADGDAPRRLQNALFLARGVQRPDRRLPPRPARAPSGAAFAFSGRAVYRADQPPERTASPLGRGNARTRVL